MLKCRISLSVSKILLKTHQGATLNYRLAQHSGVPGGIIAYITKSQCVKTMPVAYLLTFTPQCVSIAMRTGTEVKSHGGKAKLAH